MLRFMRFSITFDAAFDIQPVFTLLFLGSQRSNVLKLYRLKSLILYNMIVILYIYIIDVYYIIDIYYHSGKYVIPYIGVKRTAKSLVQGAKVLAWF